MLLLGKPPEQLTLADLERLVAAGHREGEQLDFKRDMYGHGQESKHDLLKDVTALANHRGGHLLIGVDEDTTGTATSIVGVSRLAGASTEADWIRTVCNNSIDEPVPGLNVLEISVDSERVVIVVDVPASARAPHMVTGVYRPVFYERRSTNNQPMAMADVRSKITHALTGEQRLAAARSARLDELLRYLAGLAYCVMSVTPVAFDEQVDLFDLNDQRVDSILRSPSLTTSSAHDMRLPTITPSIRGIRADNPDYAHSQQPSHEYLEVWRSGYIEFGWRLKPADRQGADDTGPGFYPTGVGAEFLWSFLHLADMLYAQFSPGTPIIIRYSLLNVRNLTLRVTVSLWPQESSPWPDDHLHLRDYRVGDLSAELRTLPARISEDFWNAFGFRHQDVFDEVGAIRYGRR